MPDAILGLKKEVRGEDSDVFIVVLLMYDIPPAQLQTDVNGDPIVLSPSAGLPAESALGPEPVTQAEKDEFDAGTSVWAIHSFLLRPTMDNADMIAEARKGWAARRLELIAEYEALAGSWENTGVRISPT